MRGRRLKLAALLSGVLVGGLFAAGCGASGDEARPASHSQPATGEQGANDSDGSDQSKSISQSAHSGSGSDQSTSINQHSSAGSSSSTQSTSGAGGVSSFSGAGATTLSFNVEHPSRLVWTNSEGKPFTAKGAGIDIDSRSGRGEIELHAGDYNNVRVDGDNWTLLVRPH